MGTPDFAVESLRKIYENGHKVMAVVTNPDRPAGRSMKLQMSPVKEYAQSKQIPVYQTERIKKDKELIDTLKGLKPDVIVVVAFGQILSQEILDIPKYGAINVHGSLLPKYRGAAPIQWAVINGDTITGITTMYMDAGMDTGDMIQKVEVKISPEDTYGTLYEKMKLAGGNLLLETLDKIIDGVATRTKQGEDFTIAPMIEKQMGQIHWENSSQKIYNLIRGFNPMPGAYTYLNGEKVKIWASKITQKEEAENSEPGVIVTANVKDGICVKTGDGYLQIVEIQMPNSKKMLATEFLKGHNIDVGIKFE